MDQPLVDDGYEALAEVHALPHLDRPAGAPASGGAVGSGLAFYVCNDCDWAYRTPTGDVVLDDVVALYIDRHNRTSTTA